MLSGICFFGPDGELARRSRSQRARTHQGWRKCLRAGAPPNQLGGGDFISFVVALNLYPPGTPLRAERIAGEMPAGLSAPAVRYLLNKLPIDRVLLYVLFVGACVQSAMRPP